MKKTLLAFSLLLTGCASIVGGSNQNVSVETFPVRGAYCQLNNDKGSWFVPQTPGSVTVHRSYSDMTIKCELGNRMGISTVKSSTKAMAFGNIIVGGVIGGAVDIGTGAAYDYPTLIRVQLR